MRERWTRERPWWQLARPTPTWLLFGPPGPATQEDHSTVSSYSRAYGANVEAAARPPPLVVRSRVATSWSWKRRSGNVCCEARASRRFTNTHRHTRTHTSPHTHTASLALGVRDVNNVYRPIDGRRASQQAKAGNTVSSLVLVSFVNELYFYLNISQSYVLCTLIWCCLTYNHTLFEYFIYFIYFIFLFKFSFSYKWFKCYQKWSLDSYI